MKAFLRSLSTLKDPLNTTCILLLFIFSVMWANFFARHCGIPGNVCEKWKKIKQRRRELNSNFWVNTNECNICQQQFAEEWQKLMEQRDRKLRHHLFWKHVCRSLQFLKFHFNTHSASRIKDLNMLLVTESCKLLENIMLLIYTSLLRKALLTRESWWARSKGDPDK